MLAILLIPAALCYTFGKMVGDTRQGWAVLAAMTIVFLALLIPCVLRRSSAATPQLAALGVGPEPPAANSRAAIWKAKKSASALVNSALWATATTAASNGSVNSMHDSFTPLGGLVPMWLMQLGEVIFGGVGSGLYGMLVFAIVAVFIAGLMVGRTPEYLGKKIEAYEMKMASIDSGSCRWSCWSARRWPSSLPQGKATIFNPGPHGFSESCTPFRRRATTTAAPSPA